MSEDLVLDGKPYISVKEAAVQTGYTRDYIGQLSRGGHIDAQRIGGLWYVTLVSLSQHQKTAELSKIASATASLVRQKTDDSAVMFDGKEYISASRGSKISHYNQDYIGQLARAKKIPSRLLGNRWYVEQNALLQHKTEKDSLLAEVQSQSVGLVLEADDKAPTPQVLRPALVPSQFTYIKQTGDLIPEIQCDTSGVFSNDALDSGYTNRVEPPASHEYPVLRVKPLDTSSELPQLLTKKPYVHKRQTKKSFAGPLSVGIGVGIAVLTGIYLSKNSVLLTPTATSFASVASTNVGLTVKNDLDRLGMELEKLLTTDLRYERPPETS